MRKLIRRTDPVLLFIIVIGMALRLYGMHWDNGFHLHPDERMLIMVADRIHFFSNLNPDFFNYGSLPIYLLKGAAQFIDNLFITNYANYDGMLIIGRWLSVFFDLGTIIAIYALSKIIFQRRHIALWSSFFYSLAFFPIQNSHFFVVDVFLTFFTTATLGALLFYLQKPSFKLLAVLGILFAAALATKITAIIFYPVIVAAIILGYIVRHTKEQHKIEFQYVLQPKIALELFTSLVIFHFMLVAAHFIFMPYAYISHIKFISDITQQIQMNSNPYIFPYTLQYVTTVPYLYYLKNIFFWGLGPIISAISLAGIFFVLQNNLRTFSRAFELVTQRDIRVNVIAERIGEKIARSIIRNYIFFITCIFYILYFILIGRSAVKFMRYMLPLYPFFVILAGYGMVRIQHLKFRARFLIPLSAIVFITLWTSMFVNIYSQVHTRIEATNWILQNIPSGSVLATEHWDDRLPIQGSEQYQFEELTIYDQPDDINKWSNIQDKLNQSDYIIIASNRLYTPLSKLDDCKKYTSCYPLATRYYHDLFAGNLQFKKVAEFQAIPSLPYLPFIHLDDQSADESFTVYDHPKIMIFKKK